MVGVASGMIGFQLSKSFLGIRNVTTKGMIAFGCYYSALLVSQKVFGDSKYHEEYTLEEYGLLKE